MRVGGWVDPEDEEEDDEATSALEAARLKAKRVGSIHHQTGLRSTTATARPPVSTAARAADDDDEEEEDPYSSANLARLRLKQTVSQPFSALPATASAATPPESARAQAMDETSDEEDPYSASNLSKLKQKQVTSSSTSFETSAAPPGPITTRRDDSADPVPGSSSSESEAEFSKSRRNKRRRSASSREEVLSSDSSLSGLSEAEEEASSQSPATRAPTLEERMSALREFESLLSKRERELGATEESEAFVLPSISAENLPQGAAALETDTESDPLVRRARVIQRLARERAEATARASRLRGLRGASSTLARRCRFLETQLVRIARDEPDSCSLDRVRDLVMDATEDFQEAFASAEMACEHVEALEDREMLAAPYLHLALLRGIEFTDQGAYWSAWPETLEAFTSSAVASTMSIETLPLESLQRLRGRCAMEVLPRLAAERADVWDDVLTSACEALEAIPDRPNLPKLIVNESSQCRVVASVLTRCAAREGSDPLAVLEGVERASKVTGRAAATRVVRDHLMGPLEEVLRSAEDETIRARVRDALKRVSS